MKLLTSVVFASAVALSGQVMADAAAGKAAYAAKGCIGCHGANGVAVVPTYPTLKGRDAGFVKQNLTEFRSGKRVGTTMNAMAAGLSDADIENLAAYISTF